MTRSGLILAAHGAGDDSEANRTVWTHVRRLGLLGLYDQVTAAFSRGTPRLSEVLDRMEADEVVVVPWDAGGGRFSDELLPTELGRNQLHDRISVRRLPPVGVHPRVADLVGRRALHGMDRAGLQSERTAVIVLGQAAASHSPSRAQTESLVEQLRDRIPCADLGAAFLDEPPTIEQAAAERPSLDLLILPFVMGWSIEAVRERFAPLGIEVESVASGAEAGGTAAGVGDRSASWGGRRIVSERPLDADPALFDVVLQMARAARVEVEAA